MFFSGGFFADNVVSSASVPGGTLKRIALLNAPHGSVVSTDKYQIITLISFGA